MGAWLNNVGNREGCTKMDRKKISCENSIEGSICSFSVSPSNIKTYSDGARDASMLKFHIPSLKKHQTVENRPKWSFGTGRGGKVQ